MAETLAERVEGLTGPDEAVDAEVCTALGILSDVTYWPMPIDGLPYWSGISKYGAPEPVPAYTASLDAVVALIGEKLPGWRWLCGDNGTGGWAQVWVGDYRPVSNGHTPALALLAAALRAIATLAADTGEK